MTEQMKPIHPAHAALLMGKRPEPCEPFVEVSSKALSRLLDVVEFGDQLERVEKDKLLSSMKELLAMEQPDLWVVHSVGPGELHPMISKEAADSQAAELAEMFKEHVGKLGLRFDVIRSPFTPLEHFESLAEELTEHRDNLLQHCKHLENKLAEKLAIELPMPVMPEQPEGAIDDSWMDGYNAALRMREQCQRAIQAADLQDVSGLIEALKYYANGDHLLLADPDAWDTCSGEPVNFLHDEAGTASVEDGSIAKAALAAHRSGLEPDQQSMSELIRRYRIAITPEHEGQWHADLYGSEAEPLARAEGATPEAAVATVVALYQSLQEQQP
ncbi:hypothetical protein [Pseudomonas sp. C11]|uniref:hypothetical protein n=1 Tax=Pseudomonas sp. C11 TaxID=3075550 RepID=UPI002AFE3032|nr:hypothetical protein [Pseudomonas sp. C11]